MRRAARISPVAVFAVVMSAALLPPCAAIAQDSERADGVRAQASERLEERLEQRIAELDRQRAELAELRDRIAAGEQLSRADRALLASQFRQAVAERTGEERRDRRGFPAGEPDARRRPPVGDESAGEEQRERRFDWNDDTESLVFRFLERFEPDKAARLRELRGSDQEAFRGVISEHGPRLLRQARQWREDPEAYEVRVRVAEADREARRMIEQAVRRARAAIDAGEDVGPVWDELRTELRPLLARQVEARLLLHRRQLERMQQRVDDGLARLEEFSAKLESQVDERLAEVINRADAAANGIDAGPPDPPPGPMPDRPRERRPGGDF